MEVKVPIVVVHPLRRRGGKVETTSLLVTDVHKNRGSNITKQRDKMGTMMHNKEILNLIIVCVDDSAIEMTLMRNASTNLLIFKRSKEFLPL